MSAELADIATRGQLVKGAVSRVKGRGRINSFLYIYIIYSIISLLAAAKAPSVRQQGADTNAPSTNVSRPSRL